MGRKHGKRKREKKQEASVALMTFIKKRKKCILKILSLFLSCTFSFTSSVAGNYISNDFETIKKIGKDVQEIKNLLVSQSTCDFPMVEPNHANLFYYQGLNFYKEGDYKTAVDRFEKAMEDQTNTGKLDALDFARCCYSMGNAYFYLMDYRNARIQYTNALGVLELLKRNEEKTAKKDGEETPIISKEDAMGVTLENEISYVHYLRCFSYLKEQDHDRAFHEYKEIGIDVDLGINEIISLSDKKNLKGILYQEYALFARDKEEIDRHLKMAINEFNYAFLLSIRHNNEKQYKKLTEKEAEMKKQECAPVVRYFSFSPMFAFTFPSHGSTVLTEESDEEEYSTLDGFPIEILGRNKSIATALTNRATMYLALGFIEDAIQDSEAALRIYQDLPLEDHKNIFDTYCNLSVAYILKEDIGKSKEYMRMALEKQKKWHGRESIQTAIAYENMGSVFFFEGHHDIAINCFVEAKRIFELHHMAEDVQKEEQSIKEIQSFIKSQS